MILSSINANKIVSRVNGSNWLMRSTFVYVRVDISMNQYDLLVVSSQDDAGVLGCRNGIGLALRIHAVNWLSNEPVADCPAVPVAT